MSRGAANARCAVPGIGRRKRAPLRGAAKRRVAARQADETAASVDTPTSDNVRYVHLGLRILAEAEASEGTAPAAEVNGPPPA